MTADEHARGRRRGRPAPLDPVAGDGGRASDGSADADADADADVDVDVEDRSRKRRRSRKALDKKFECPWDGCGKSYSRAEHMYRHQLNHSSKPMFRCNFQSCTREFYRQDLCARHRERHTAKNLPLARPDDARPDRTSAPTSSPSHHAHIDHRPDIKPNPDPDPDLARPDHHHHHRTSTLTSLPHQPSPSPHPRSEMMDATATVVAVVSTVPSTSSSSSSSSSSPYDRTGAHVSHALKRANSETSGLRADDPRRIFESSVPPRSTPPSNLHPTRRGASFGSMDAGRPRFAPEPDGDGFVRPIRPTAMSSYLDPTHSARYAPPYTSVSTASPSHPAMMHRIVMVNSGAGTDGDGDGGGGGGGGMAHVGHARVNGGGGKTTMVGPPPPPPPSSSYTTDSQAMYVHSSNFVPLSLPPPVYNTMSHTGSSHASEASLVTSPPTSLSSVEPPQSQHPSQTQHPPVAATRGTIPSAVTDPTPVDPSTYGATPFGGYGYSRSPFTMPEAFAEWLFSESQLSQSTSIGAAQTISSNGIFNHHGTGFAPPLPSSFAPDDLTFDGFDPQLLSHQHPMAVTSILDPEPVASLLSVEKRRQLIDLIESRFNEPDQAPVTRRKADLLDGDRDADGHLLSLSMLRTYIASYWCQFHPQLPMLHRPTFVPDETQNLLLIAMIAIGASCLPKSYGLAATREAAQLANFLATHLRWEIFIHAHFTPPAKLWVFQALLLLEVYEKLYSTRMLHERSHIHHAATVTLMRRGSSLVGKSALDSPPNAREEKVSDGGGGASAGGVGGNGGGLAGTTTTSSLSSSSGPAATSDRWWNEWITAEATRRAAFVAFVLDAMHAQMFGHSAVMVAHEMQLPLPYDEALWSATTGAEVGRQEASLKANGIKRISFLEGLKQTLNHKSVRTNAFGRTILMAGLLSVTWHMKERDLQLRSLGAGPTMGGRERWRSALTKAYDFWKQDFDDAMAEHPEPSSDGGSVDATLAGSRRMQEDIIFESNNVLHHLAHMTMHVDIVHCQIFARAPRLLGRTISPQDYTAATDRMKEWASTAKGRDATYYALRFLADVLCPAPGRGPPAPSHGHGYNHSKTRTAAAAATATQSTILTDGQPADYSAREDYLMNRPWVLYFAALTVWSYGYALEGPLTPTTTTTTTTINGNHHHHTTATLTAAEKHHQMRTFLDRVGGVSSPEGLSAVRGRNQSVGVLMVVRDMFETTRWELLEEANRLLSNCIDMLLGTYVPS